MQIEVCVFQIINCESCHNFLPHKKIVWYNMEKIGKKSKINWYMPVCNFSVETA
jgi:hypothetical protein